MPDAGALFFVIFENKSTKKIEKEENLTSLAEII